MRAARQRMWACLTRRKQLCNGGDSTAAVGDIKGPLARVLSLGDLVGLAVGSTLGLGIYVLAGDVARNTAGPAVVLSFMVAAAASLLAGLCYAEFAARVPRAGSAYVYSYVCIGEFVAFVIGWNLILEYLIGTASVARGYSVYTDSVLGGSMTRAFHQCCPIHVPSLSTYPDFFAFFLVMALSSLLAIGVKESIRFNNAFTACNLVVVVFVVVCGSFKADLNNWRVDPGQVTVGQLNSTTAAEVSLGDGGFFPFGVGGMLAGAARCFFGFVGFDAVATTGEEAIQPERTIPLAILIGLMVIFLCYFSVATVLTLMTPYFLQDARAPLPAAFYAVKWNFAGWVVSIGALFGLSASLLGGLFPLPRILYAMANDGLIFRQLGVTHERYHTPFLATLVSGLLAAVLAAIFELHQLVDMLSIGTLLAYTMVSTCVLVLRYRDENVGVAKCSSVERLDQSASRTLLRHSDIDAGWLSQLLNCAGHAQPHERSTRIVHCTTVVYGLLTLLLCVLVNCVGLENVVKLSVYPVPLMLLLLLVLATCCCVVVVWCQPESQVQLYFKVPCVPLLPMLSILVNVFLMLRLSVATWIRFSIWMTLGFIMYFGYGVHNSSGGCHEFERVQLTSSSPGDSSPMLSSRDTVHWHVQSENTALIGNSDTSITSVN